MTSDYRIGSVFIRPARQQTSGTDVLISYDWFGLVAVGFSWQCGVQGCAILLLRYEKDYGRWYQAY